MMLSFEEVLKTIKQTKPIEMKTLVKDGIWSKKYQLIFRWKQ